MGGKAKKKLLNVIMILLILGMAAGGVIAVGSVKGWFSRPEDTMATTGTIKGIVSMERKEISYALEPDTALLSGDFMETKTGAQAELLWQETGKLVLNEDTQMVLSREDGKTICFWLEQGELFGNAADSREDISVTFAKQKADLSGTVFSISTQDGSSRVNVYRGTGSVALEDGRWEQVEAGQTLSVVKNQDGSISCEVEELQIEGLSEFQIRQMQDCDNTKLCFTGEDLQKTLDTRADEKKSAIEEELKDKASARQNEESSAARREEEQTESGEEEGGTCTITIRCDTILDNMESLDPGKAAYVPADGIILAKSSVNFQKGETVFDVLTRVCETADIQIEYSWTAVYDSYYIEGIHHLYEFDCGNESGWMYQVNEQFPNYGCSSYELEDGDDIVWCYTCNGFGEDVGGTAR